MGLHRSMEFLHKFVFHCTSTPGHGSGMKYRSVTECRLASQSSWNSNIRTV